MHTLRALTKGLNDSRELYALAREESDDDTLLAVEADATTLEQRVADLEFRRMFHNPLDPGNAFLDIQAGSGGTEAQDWAAML